GNQRFRQRQRQRNGPSWVRHSLTHVSSSSSVTASMKPLLPCSFPPPLAVVAASTNSSGGDGTSLLHAIELIVGACTLSSAGAPSVVSPNPSLLALAFPVAHSLLCSHSLPSSLVMLLNLPPPSKSSLHAYDVLIQTSSQLQTPTATVSTVVKRDVSATDASFLGSYASAGTKRSARDRLGNNADSSSWYGNELSSNSCGNELVGANILVDNKGCIKLADFEASKQVVELRIVVFFSSMNLRYWVVVIVVLLRLSNL
ncbi:hypothetical protein HN51_051603, partial [Arachis hypogaea]